MPPTPGAKPSILASAPHAPGSSAVHSSSGLADMAGIGKATISTGGTSGASGLGNGCMLMARTVS